MLIGFRANLCSWSKLVNKLNFAGKSVPRASDLQRHSLLGNVPFISRRMLRRAIIKRGNLNRPTNRPNISRHKRPPPLIRRIISSGGFDEGELKVGIRVSMLRRICCPWFLLTDADFKCLCTHSESRILVYIERMVAHFPTRRLMWLFTWRETAFLRFETRPERHLPATCDCKRLVLLRLI